MAALPLGPEARGGFLLGATAEGYAVLVAHAHVLVLEAGGGIVGLAVSLPDPVLRASEVWTLRERIAWDGVDAATVEQARLGYFDQLALLPESRLKPYAPVLAFTAVDLLLAEGVRHLFATTLREPFHNPAAWPLLEALGARAAGRVEEVYPEVGRTVSDIHHLDLDERKAERLQTHPLARRLRMRARQLGWGAQAVG
jgi:hypothetical protein